MLSFDITDRVIHVVSGTEKNGRIKITSSATINLEAGLIENGFVTDMMSVASRIGGTLKVKRMLDKVAQITLSSNRIIFKELSVPKSKGAQFKTMVQNQLVQSMNVSEEQSVSYIVVGDDISADGKERTTKVLATACPTAIVESYKKVFALIGISLKDVTVNHNSINKLVMNDQSLKMRMPFFLVQIDPTFININIYESGTLTFSRFASISPDNYDDRSDYIFQAVTENVFRVLQFQKQRSKEVIKNVVIYGDTSLYIRLTNELEKLDLRTSLLKVNDGISGYEKLEFSQFATAIGALYKNIKETDSTNLLQVDIGTTKQVDVSAGSLGMRMGLVFFASCAIVAGAFFALDYFNKGYVEDIEEVDKYLNSQSVLEDIEKFNDINMNKSLIDSKISTVENEIKVIDTYPALRQKLISQVNAYFEGYAYNFVSLEYANGIMKLRYEVENEQTPRIVASKISKEPNDFLGYGYNGYESISAGSNTNSKMKYAFDILLVVKGENTLKEKEQPVIKSFEGGGVQ